MIKDVLILTGLSALSAGVALRFGVDIALIVGGGIVLVLGMGIRK